MEMTESLYEQMTNDREDAVDDQDITVILMYSAKVQDFNIKKLFDQIDLHESETLTLIECETHLPGDDADAPGDADDDADTEAGAGALR
jgi:hypothetical protein